MKRKIFLSLIISVLFFFSGCKTIERVVKEERNVTDSIENARLKTEIFLLKNELVVTKTQVKESNEKLSTYIDKLNLSENEKQQLKESVETIHRKYNAQGQLIEEIQTKKNTETQRELNKQLEQIRELNEKLRKQSEYYSIVEDNYSIVYKERDELEKELKLRKNELTQLKSSRKSDVFSLKWFLWGIKAGVWLVFVLMVLWKWKGRIWFEFMKRLIKK